MLYCMFLPVPCARIAVGCSSGTGRLPPALTLGYDGLKGVVALRQTLMLGAATVGPFNPVR